MAPDPIMARQSTRADLELRAGITPIEELLREREAITARLAQLRPLFGPLGGWDYQRSIELARIKVLIRAHATATGQKPLTVDEVNTEAHAHPEYVAFVHRGLVLAEEWVQCEERLKAIDMTINRDQALLRFVTHEPRVGP